MKKFVLPKHLDEKAMLHLEKLVQNLQNVKRTSRLPSVKPSGPFKPDTYRY